MWARIRARLTVGIGRRLFGVANRSLRGSVRGLGDSDNDHRRAIQELGTQPRVGEDPDQGFGRGVSTLEGG